MTSADSLQQNGLRAAATIRRAFASFNQETTEFALAAAADSREMMEVARGRAHDHLDCYFDALAAAHELGREVCSGQR